MLMVHPNTPHMKTARIKGPPPVPPRPNQTVVNEALSKTRKAVADSKSTLANKRPVSHQDPLKTRAKTIDRATGVTPPAPKQNGLARVKSFIRDVIGDRGSSSGSSGRDSRRSSSDSTSIPLPVSHKRSNESLNSKAVKTCRHILVRSVSSSNKLDDNAKGKVSKSSSFAEKTLPLRKAPPPPLSPKPKLKQLRPRPGIRNSLEKPVKKPSLDFSPYSSPIDAKPPQIPLVDENYATVDEVQVLDDRLKNQTSQEVCQSPQTPVMSSSPPSENPESANTNSLEKKTSRVTEMLISEILASRNIKDASHDEYGERDRTELRNGSDSPEIIKDMNNHEMLIYELQTMRSKSDVPEALSEHSVGDSDYCESGYSNIDVVAANGHDIVHDHDRDHDDHDDQAYAYVLDDDLKSRLRRQYTLMSSMSLEGLPPLPKSLSGFAAEHNSPPHSPGGSPPHSPGGSPPHSPEGPPPATADLHTQLSYLKKEMASLRQLDLSLLSELWTLHEALSSWRREPPAPPAPPPPRLRPAPPPPPPLGHLRT